jgi:hypothetical protein
MPQLRQCDTVAPGSASNSLRCKRATQNEFYLKLSLRAPALRLVSRVSSKEAMGVSSILGYSNGPSRTGYRI